MILLRLVKLIGGALTFSLLTMLLCQFCNASVSQTPALQVDLSHYQLQGTYLLPPKTNTNPVVLNANEASAVTYNWDTNTLFVMGDEGGNIVEVSLTGELLSKMTIVGFEDTEGITYIGNSKFVLVEERNRDAYQLTYAANTFKFRSSLTRVDLGTYVDNIGIEGISFDRPTGQFITVKEKSPQEVNINSMNFTTGASTINTLFTPNLGVLDLADVQALSIVPTLTSDANNLLLISQESSVLLETDRSGNILSQFDLSALATTAEGVTIDYNGNIYVVAENGVAPQLFVLSPVVNVMTQTQVPMSPWWVLLLMFIICSMIGFRYEFRRKYGLF